MTFPPFGASVALPLQPYHTLHPSGPAHQVCWGHQSLFFNPILFLKPQVIPWLQYIFGNQACLRFLLSFNLFEIFQDFCELFRFESVRNTHRQKGQWDFGNRSPESITPTVPIQFPIKSLSILLGAAQVCLISEWLSQCPPCSVSLGPKNPCFYIRHMYTT